ncbi:MAG: DUF4238 domain-containing protein [Patescibacteria group bacterium]|nr:DUF4238 domain-containing protein [Patescibacteria group bacterium]
MKNNNPIKQHTVPNFYLKNFADSNFCTWVYDKKKSKIRNQPTKNTTIKKDFYTIEIKSKSKDYRVETDLFANNIEKEFAPVLLDVIKNKKILESQKEIIRLFVILQHSRTTIFKKRYENIIKKEKEEYIMKEYNNEIEKEGIKRIEVHPHKNTNLKGMLENFEFLEKGIEKMSFLLFEANGNEQFITSDNPAIVIAAKKLTKPISTPITNIIYYPLAPNLTLVLNDYGVSGLKKANKKTVNFLNRFLYRQADQFIISRKRKKLLNFIKTNIDFEINQTDFEIFEKTIYQSR